MNPNSYVNALAEQRRIAILQCINADPDHKLNDALLRSLLMQLDVGVSLSVLHCDLAWLEERGLISTQKLPGCMSIYLLQEGIDTAEGMVAVPGIARPVRQNKG